MRAPPPVLALIEELTSWTAERAASFPRPYQATLGRRLDAVALELLELGIEARFASKGAKDELLGRMNVKLEVLRALWRTALDRGGIVERQAVYVHVRIDEIGRMIGAWKRSVERTHGATKNSAGSGTEAG